MSSALKLMISIAAPLAVGAVSGLATAGATSEWYQRLEKPSFSPPNWVFGPVWTVLYIAMGVACYLVWRRGVETDGVKLALVLYGVQLVLNGLWSPLFFGLQDPRLALVDIVALIVMIGLTIVAFARVDRAAAWLMTPYLAWVAFATVLNASIWSLNR